MLGLPPGGFPRSLEGWLERLHPDDRERVRRGGLAQTVSAGAVSPASTGCATATARIARSTTRESS